jgi:hypothetical protein
MSRIALFLATVLGVLALAPLAVAATTPQSVTVTITNVKLTFAAKVHPGTVTFHLLNKGTIARVFRIDGKTTALIAPGKSGTLRVTLKKGSYAYTSTAKGRKTLTGKLAIAA